MSDKLHKIPVLILLLSIFGYTIVAMLALMTGIENQFASILYRFFIVLLSFGIIFTFGLSVLESKRRISAYLFMFLLFSFFLFFSFRASLDSFIRASEIDSSALSMFWVFLFGVTFLPTVAVSIGWRSFAAQNTFLCSSGVMLGLIAVSMILFLWGYQNGFNTLIGGRIEFDTLNPISMGHVGASLLIFAFSYYQTTRSSFIYKSSILLFSVALGAVLIVAAGSRGPILSIFSVFLFAVAFSPRLSFYGKLGFLIFVVLFLVAVLILFGDAMIVSRVTTGLFDDPARIKIFTDSFAILKNNFLVGGGIMNMDTYPHNFILESFVVVGFFGGVVYLLINILALYASVQVYKKKISFVVPMLFVQYFVAGLFSGTIHEAAVFWMTLAILFLLIYINATSVSGRFVKH